MEPDRGDQRPHLPSPSLWPVGFAVGIVCILAGLIVSPPAVALGVVITVIFGFMWVREVTAEQRRPPAPVESEPAGPERTRPAPAIPANEGPAAMPESSPEEIDAFERFPRSKFLEGATLGIGAAIGGIVTVPAVGLAVLPAFVNQEKKEVDIGPLSEFPEGQWRIATFLEAPEEGEVSRRTAYVRNNGLLAGAPSFTAVSNRCVHLGCPVQPGGPSDEENKRMIKSESGAQIELTPTQPSNFGCPCHGGSYDTEGNRRAGPPVRALDRYEFAIRNGRVFLGKTYSVSEVEGQGKEARIKKYKLASPGQHVDGIESWLYPVQPPGK